MAWRHFHVDLFVKVRVYECVYRIVLDHLEIKTSGDGHKRSEAAACECRGVRIRFRTGLLVSSDYKACLTFDESAVFVEFVDVYLHAVENLHFLLSDRGPVDLKP